MRANEFVEASYPGNIGAMEVVRFMQTATPRQKTVLRKLIDADQLSKAWQLIQKVTGVRLQGREFAEAYQGGPITDQVSACRIYNPIVALNQELC